MGREAADTRGGVFPGPAIPRKWVLAKTIIEKLPMIAPMSPTTDIQNIVRDFTGSKSPFLNGL
jgi:hypothetical protein